MYVDVFPPQSTVFTITGLKGSTTYNFSVNAINVLGDSNYADGDAVVSVTTQGYPWKRDGGGGGVYNTKVFAAAFLF